MGEQFTVSDNTIKINHLGDWGKQFGLLTVAYKKWGSQEAVEANPIDELLKLYVRINAEIENDPSLDEEGRLWFKKLEDGELTRDDFLERGAELINQQIATTKQSQATGLSGIQRIKHRLFSAY